MSSIGHMAMAVLLVMLVVATHQKPNLDSIPPDLMLMLAASADHKSAAKNAKENATISCYCTPNRCPDIPSCLLRGNDSCFHMSISVEENGDIWNSSGCTNGSLSNDVMDSLTVMIIRAGLAHLAILECSHDNCNDPSRVSWSSIGIDDGCFNKSEEILSVAWDHEGIVHSLDWCSNCPKNVKLPLPAASETLCKWMEKVRALNETETKKKEGQVPYMISSGAVVGLVFLLGVALSLVEFLKALKDKRARPAHHKKKKAPREIKLASPLQPFTVLPQPAKAPATDAKASVPGGKEAAVAQDAKAPAKDAKEPSSKSAAKSAKK